MPRFLSSLRFRLLILVLLALIPILGLTIYNYSEQRQLAAAQEKENALRIARVTATNYGQLVEAARQLLIVLTQIPAVVERNPVTCRVFLVDLLKKYPHYLQIGVVERDGAVSCTAIPDNKPMNLANDPLFQRVSEVQDFVVGEYRIGFISGRGAVAFGYPLYDRVGQYEGFVFASLDLGFLNDLATQVLLPTGSTLTLRDRNGTILARYPDPENWVGQTEPESPIFKIISVQRSEGTVEAVGIDNVPRLYAFTPLSSALGNETYVSVGIPTAVAYGEVDQALVRNLIMLGLVTLFAVTAAWIGGDFFILRQVDGLVAVTKRLVVGDLQARTGIPYRNGELGELASAFDQMAAALEEREVERNQVEEQIRRWSTELEELIQGVAEAISQPMEMSKIADVALDRTLKAMSLDVGCVIAKRARGFVLISHRGAPGRARRIQTLLESEAANQEVNQLIDSDAVRQIPDGAILTTLEAGEEAPLIWTSVPIKSKNRDFGIMGLANPQRSPFAPQEEGVLAAVGLLVGIAMENSDLYEQVQSIATLKERERLSRELHDGLAQVLGYLSIRNQVAMDLVAASDVERAGVQLQEMQRIMEEAYQDVRESILGLRTTVSPKRGLVAALKEYAKKFSQQTGIRTNVILDGNDQVECDPETEVQLLRIIQEALSNVRKHSRAKQAWIKFDLGADLTVVTIEDDGGGFDPAAVDQNLQPHFGMQTMQERAEGVGGHLQFHSRRGQGTRVVVTLPVDHGGKQYDAIG